MNALSSLIKTTAIIILFAYVFSTPTTEGAENTNYTDIFFSNFKVDDETLTFDLSRRISSSERMSVYFAITKEGGNEPVIRDKMTMNGGKHVTMSGWRQTLHTSGYGNYTFHARLCPDDIPYEGSGVRSGCGPVAKFQFSYMPWHLSSSASKDEKNIIAVDGQSFTVFGKEVDDTSEIPHIVPQYFGKPTDIVQCSQAQQRNAWNCTVHTDEETYVELVLESETGKVSNPINVSVFTSDRFDAAEFISYCDIYLVEQKGNRYIFETVRRDSRNRDALCENAIFSAHDPAKILSHTSHTVTIEAPPTDYFTIFAEKGDGSGPRLLHSENDSFLSGFSCQTLILQDDTTFTLLRRNDEGKTVSSCTFPSVTAIPVSGTPHKISQTNNQIIFDATEPNTFKLNAGVSPYVSPIDYDRLPSQSIGEEPENTNTIEIGLIKIVPIQNGIMETDPPMPTAFKDVPLSHPNASSIAYAKEHNLVGGYDDGTYHPDQIINRAEFAKIIVSAIMDHKDILSCVGNKFTDTISDTWYSIFLCAAKRNGLIDGYPDGTFRPAISINFVEAAKILVHGFRVPMETENNNIWYLPYTDTLVGRNIVPPTILSMDQPITRGEMAEMIYRLHAGDTVQPAIDYENLLRQSGVMQQLEEAMEHYEWRGADIPVKDILRYKNLKTLILNFPKIRNIPEELIGLSHLESLIVYSQSLQSLPENIASWPNLKLLKIGSGFESPFILPESIGDLSQLETLIITDHSNLNKIPKSIGKLSNLKVLDLHNNGLTRLPSEIGSLSMLEELDLHFNQIEEWPKELSNLKKLHTFRGSNKTSDEQREYLQQLLPWASVRFW